MSWIVLGLLENRYGNSGEMDSQKVMVAKKMQSSKAHTQVLNSLSPQ
jgi:hypothetical protein